LVFEDISGVKATMDQTLILGAVNSAKDEIIELREKIAAGKVTAAEFINDIDHLLGDLEGLLGGS
jgi:hypothetical protein